MYTDNMHVMYGFLAMLVVMIELVLLALAASFSPTLYIAQASSSSKRQASSYKTYAPLVGVLSALVLMLVIFRFMHLDALVLVLGSVFGALIVSTMVAIVVGIVCVYGGLRLIKNRHFSSVSKPHSTVGNSGALMWAGFLRTFFSLSGQTATFLAVSAVAATGVNLLLQAIFIFMFLLVSSAPFFAVGYLTSRSPDSIEASLAMVNRVTKQPRYRTYVGIVAIVLGVLIILAQVLGMIG